MLAALVTNIQVKQAMGESNQLCSPKASNVSTYKIWK